MSEEDYSLSMEKIETNLNNIKKDLNSWIERVNAKKNADK